MAAKTKASGHKKVVARKKTSKPKMVAAKTASSKKAKPKLRLVRKKMSAKAKTKTKSKQKTLTHKLSTKKQTRKKTTTKHHAGKTQHQSKGSNVIWKFLEMKEAKRREQAEKIANGEKHHSYNYDDNRTHGKHDGFSRFSGPRRKAA